MYSVTKRVNMVKQPYGGYLPRKQFNIETFSDGKILNEKENIHASLIGLVVDYLTRFMMGSPVEEAFKISIMGALNLGQITKQDDSIKKTLMDLLIEIEGLDSRSITNACKLAGYDVCYRAGVIGYIPVEEINPDRDTIENIKIMVERSLEFWDQYGEVVVDGFTFEGGYTDVISSGDGDYLTKDTLWDFKVSKNEPNKNHTLQLLIYYIMWCHSTHGESVKIENLGLFNPRKNKVYTLSVSSISVETIHEVSEVVIGY